MTFTELGLSDGVMRAVSEAGYETPTPIQKQAIPQVLMGRDVLGCAQTGTGKTASFTLPMIDILGQGRARARMPRSLILEPTRELAAQVAENFETYGKYTKLTTALLIGGVSFTEQFKKLDRGVDVLIATPGRLMDHVERGKVMMNDVNFLVIDEADRMLDMGFIPDVERIVSFITKKHQTLLFSATMPPEIKRLAKKFLTDPREITVAPPSSVADTVQQAIVIVQSKDKREALRSLLNSQTISNALIFCNRKRDIGVLHRSLERHGFSVGALHGDMDQFQRTDTLDKFKANEIQILVCSDVAARGLDIAAVSHVFNFDVPSHAEDYVHRIGRTGRAGRSGHAFTLAAPEDGKYVTAIEKLAGREIPRVNIEEIAGAELKQDSGKGRGRDRGRGRGKATTKQASEQPQSAPSTEQPAEASATDQPADSSSTEKPADARRDERTQDRKARDKRTPDKHSRGQGEKTEEKQSSREGNRPRQDKDNKRGSRRDRDSIGDAPEYGDVPFGETDLVPAFLKRPATL
ncbi:MAG: DEAD/DEAH box helicase [Alphaproteobacteria bacterium]|nr:DEAD/DEAH box helicase [Alphaproteobacteria bacterium]